MSHVKPMPPSTWTAVLGVRDRRVRASELGRGGSRCGVVVAGFVEHRGRGVGGALGQAGADVHVGQQVLDRLERADGRAELLALERVAPCDLERAGGDAARASRRRARCRGRGGHGRPTRRRPPCRRRGRTSARPASAGRADRAGRARAGPHGGTARPSRRGRRAPRRGRRRARRAPRRRRPTRGGHITGGHPSHDDLAVGGAVDQGRGEHGPEQRPRDQVRHRAARRRSRPRATPRPEPPRILAEQHDGRRASARSRHRSRSSGAPSRAAIESKGTGRRRTGRRSAAARPGPRPAGTPSTSPLDDGTGNL